MNSIIEQLLKKRGISGEEAVTEFLSERPKKTYDPFLLPDMEAGVDLILRAISAGRKICIYGDYDADGITSTCLMKIILERAGADVFFFLPSRFREGYGLNADAIDRIREQGAEVIITVDCGSVSYDEVEHAKSIGLEIVVTDHHTIGETRADCLLINPKRADSEYPCRDLAGCGVAYKFAQAIQRKCDLPKSAITDILDLVAIGTIGDIVPLKDENRTLVKYGLREIRKTKRPGLKALIEGISLAPENIGSEQIAYGIVPNLNACGRMEDATYGAELMLAKDREDALPLVDKVTAFNSKRKKTQDETYKKCIQLISEQCAGSDFPVVFAEGAHEGITGIVAGKLKEKLNRPVLVVTESGDFLKGTGRSIETVDLYEIMNRQNDLFERFGGHSGACGFTMIPEHLDELRKRLSDDIDVMSKENPGIFDSSVSYDLELMPEEADIKLAEELKALEPFGNSNEEPKFLIKGAVPKYVNFMGQEDQHVRFTSYFPGGRSIKCVLFGEAQDHSALINSGCHVDVIGSLGINEWNGRKNAQMILDDVRG